MPYSTNWQARYVWAKARRVKGKNPNLYRRDYHGNVIYKPAYGKNSPMGWQVDHIWPKSKGGFNARRNLQVLQTSPDRGEPAKIEQDAKAEKHSVSQAPVVVL